MVTELGRLAKDFYCFKELGLIVLNIECSWLLWWLLIVVSYVWANLIINKVYMKNQIMKSGVFVWKCVNDWNKWILIVSEFDEGLDILVELQSYIW